MNQQQMSSLALYFAERLRRARGDRSQAEFARKLGIKHQQTYQAYESGRVPDGLMLHQIASKLGVTIDELLTGGKTESPAVLKTGEEQLMSWGVELEENLQFSVALEVIAQQMSSSQLLKASRGLINNSILNERSKMFWVRMLANLTVKQAENEEFERLTLEQRLARIDNLKPSEQSETMRPSLTTEAELASRNRLKQFFLNQREKDGMIPIDPSRILSAVECGVPVEQILLKMPAGMDDNSSDKPQVSALTQAEKAYLLQWEAYFQALGRGENPVRPLLSVGRIK